MPRTAPRHDRDAGGPADLLAAKAALRSQAWAALRSAGVARFPGAVGRIPNFTGAEAAAERLRDLPAWAGAQTVKANPDSPQLRVRQRALEDGKTLWARRTLAATDGAQPAKLTALAVLDRVAPAGTALDLSGIDLRHADLSDRDLSGASIRGATLRGMHLDRVNLAGADLAGADFSQAILRGGSLRDATLGGSRWHRAAIPGTGGLATPEDTGPPGLDAAAIAGRDTPPVMVDSSAGPALCLAYSPDGELLAHGAGSRVVISDAATGQALRFLPGHQGHVAGVAPP
ncbi:MAG TPA: pentapeptide repeat-containing protein [Trebonia sp.]|jgi:uncharacterized protein YjbI with pentapeptide repeats|nr:pentapeptide repeat-containing protein [Trebonia sp.]